MFGYAPLGGIGRFDVEWMVSLLVCDVWFRSTKACAKGVVKYGGTWYVYVYQNGFVLDGFRYGFVMVSSIHRCGV